MKIDETVFEETYIERTRTESTRRGPGPQEADDRNRPGVSACHLERDAQCGSGGEAAEERDWAFGEELPPFDDFAEDADAGFACAEELEEHRFGSYNKHLGRRGENAAAFYLDRMGFEILERNWTCPFGEADIIARDGDTLVFVEVKTRTGVGRGFPAEAVDARKRARYEKIAGWFLKDYDVTNVPVRFDVIGLMVLGSDRAFLKHYVNAFGVGE